VTFNNKEDSNAEPMVKANISWGQGQGKLFKSQCQGKFVWRSKSEFNKRSW